MVQEVNQTSVKYDFVVIVSIAMIMIAGIGILMIAGFGYYLLTTPGVCC